MQGICRTPARIWLWLRCRSDFADLGHRFFGNVEIGRDVLHVVVIVEPLHQLQNLAPSRRRDQPSISAAVKSGSSRARSCARPERRLRPETPRDRKSPRSCCRRGARHRPPLQGQFHERVLFDLRGGNHEQPFVLEHPGHAARLTELAFGQFEYLANFGGGAIAIVGENLAQYRHATGPYPSYSISSRLPPSSSPVPRLMAADVVLRHADGLGCVDRVSQLEVHGRIAAPRFRGHDDGLRHLAPHLAALCVDQRFLVGDVRPMGMTCHYFPCYG